MVARSKNSKRLKYAATILVAVALVIGFAIYEWPSGPKPVREMVFHTASAQFPVGQITVDNTVLQSFKLSGNNFDEIDVLFATYGRKNTGSVQVSLTDSSGTNIFQQSLDVSNLRDNTFVPFKFPPVKNSSGKTFSLSISSSNTNHKNAVTVWAMRPPIPADTSLKLGGKSNPGVIVFDAFLN